MGAGGSPRVILHKFHITIPLNQRANASAPTTPAPNGKRHKKKKASQSAEAVDDEESGGERRRSSGEAFRRVDGEFWSTQIIQGLEDNSCKLVPNILPTPHWL